MSRLKNIGTVTVGISFLIVGAVLLLRNWFDFSIILFLAYLWPIVLILLGLEFIYKRRKDEEEELEPRPFDRFAVTILFIVLLISGGFFSLKNADWKDVFYIFTDHWQTSLEIEESYDVRDIEISSFSFTNSNVELVSGEGNEIRIEGIIKSQEKNKEKVRDMFEKAKKIKEDDKKFEYTVKPSPSIFSFRNSFVADFTITVPNYVKVELSSTNGTLTGENINNDVELDTTNGKIEAHSIDGNLEANSTNGVIRIYDVTGSAKAKTTNGNVVVENVGEDLYIKTTNGSITVKSDKVGGDWDASTTNGKVKMTIPKDASVEIEGSTTNGSVDGDFTWERRYEGSRKKRQGSAILNDGDYEIYVKSTNGSIKIYQE